MTPRSSRHPNPEYNAPGENDDSAESQGESEGESEYECGTSVCSEDLSRGRRRGGRAGGSKVDPTQPLRSRSSQRATSKAPVVDKGAGRKKKDASDASDASISASRPAKDYAKNGVDITKDLPTELEERVDGKADARSGRLDDEDNAEEIKAATRGRSGDKRTRSAPVDGGGDDPSTKKKIENAPKSVSTGSSLTAAVASSDAQLEKAARSDTTKPVAVRVRVNGEVVPGKLKIAADDAKSVISGADAEANATAPVVAERNDHRETDAPANGSVDAGSPAADGKEAFWETLSNNVADLCSERQNVIEQTSLMPYFDE